MQEKEQDMKPKFQESDKHRTEQDQKRSKGPGFFLYIGHMIGTLISPS